MFIDLAAVDGGTLELEEILTAPANFVDDVLTVVEKSTLDLVSPDQSVHGTTVAINAITERAGQETTLLTTTGFHDVLDITRTNRPDMFNYQYEKPESFVPQRYR